MQKQCFDIANKLAIKTLFIIYVFFAAHTDNFVRLEIAEVM